MAFSDFLQTCQARIEHVLPDAIQLDGAMPERLIEAVRYVVLASGKRLRPLLVYAAGHALGTPLAHLDAPACAIELIHAYSLVHDDLPAMDDDAMRRGQPTCHIAFDEPTAILVGDLLQSLAFLQLSAEHQRLVPILAQASALMVCGQMRDITASNTPTTLQELERLHHDKTGALIQAALRMGADAGEASATQKAAIDTYAEALGLAFQVQDDILDVEGDAATLGKATGADALMHKTTYPSLLGMAAAKRKVATLQQRALDAIAHWDDKAAPLREIAQFVVARNH